MLPDPYAVSTLVDFMKATMLDREAQSMHDQAILDALRLDFNAITTPEELAMAARVYHAVEEAGRWAGRQAAWQEGRQEGAREVKVDLMVDLLLPVAGADFEEELRMLLDDEQLLSRLDVNTMVELRLRHGSDPVALRQAVRDLLGNLGDLV